MQGHLFYLKQTEGYDADITIKRKTYSRTFSLRNIQMNVEKGQMLLLLWGIMVRERRR